MHAYVYVNDVNAGNACMYAGMTVCMYLRIYKSTHLYVCLYMYIRMYVCMQVCKYAFF